MHYINQFREGENISDIYYCKRMEALQTKTGKTYYSAVMQDKTGTVDAKIWEVHSPGIEDFEAGDFVQLSGRVTSFQGNLQLNIERIYRVSEGMYNMADYMPCSEYDVDEMFDELVEILRSVKENHLRHLIKRFFVEDQDFIKAFKGHSAAKSVHHGFIGGLLEHTLHVTKMCQFYGTLYKELNMDLLLTAAAFHDIGKLKELSTFPTNDYTDDGQLLGHIVMGIVQIDKAIDEIEGFPPVLRSELEHLIASHHGELEYGSPKKPALMEGIALHFADNTDAKLETFKEALAGQKGSEWSGFNRLLESPIRRTTNFTK